MSAAALTCRKAIRLANGLVDTGVLLAVLLLLAAGCYALWDAELVYMDADAANYATYKPAEDSLSFEELKALNPEVFAWLTVYGTHIDYPVVRSPDNMKYVNTNAKGDYSLSGAIFLDGGSSPDFSDFASILYGHHMEKNAMFGEIGRFADKAFFDERAYGSLYYDGREHGIEFFAFLRADAYDGRVFRTGVRGREAGRAYLDMLLGRAAHTRGTGAAEEGRIVLLSTCTSSTDTNGRDILAGRITDELYADAFKTRVGSTGLPAAADRIIGLWSLIPPWARPAAPALVLIAASLALRHARRREEQGVIDAAAVKQAGPGAG
jgi:sortase B